MTRTTLTRRELDIMEVLWERGACAIREIHEALPDKRRPAFTTVQTVVYRLETMGMLRRAKRIGRAVVVDAVVSRQAAHTSLVDQLLHLFDGRAHLLVARLAETGKLTLDDVKQAEDAVRRFAKKGRRR